MSEIFTKFQYLNFYYYKTLYYILTIAKSRDKVRTFSR